MSIQVCLVQLDMAGTVRIRTHVSLRKLGINMEDLANLILLVLSSLMA